MILGVIFALNIDHIYRLVDWISGSGVAWHSRCFIARWAAPVTRALEPVSDKAAGGFLAARRDAQPA